MCIHPCMAWWFYPSHAFGKGSPFTISTNRQICVHPPCHTPIISQFTHHFSYIAWLIKDTKIWLYNNINFPKSYVHGMSAREQNAMMVCFQTQLYWSVHRFMGLIIWTHSHHTSDSYLQLWLLLVPSHYCFGTQNIEIQKEKWLFGWISSSRKLQRPSFNR